MDLIFHQNYESDFILRFRFADGRPTHPWEIVFSTSKYDEYAASFDGERYLHATPEADNSDYIRVEFNDHRLACGSLRYKLFENVPDAFFADGMRKTVLPVRMPFELWCEKSDDVPLTPEFEILTKHALRGYSAYEIAVQNGYTATELEYAQSPIVAARVATGATEDVRALERQVQDAERGRNAAEWGRAENESMRQSSEVDRVAAESKRIADDVLRATAEGVRSTQELERVDSESSRRSVEKTRATAESSRKTEESARAKAETTRRAAEMKRQEDATSAIARTDGAAVEAREAAQSIVEPLAVLAHSDCTLEERVAHLEQVLFDALSGRTYIPALKVRDFEAWGEVLNALTGAGAPSQKPDKVGQFYIDTMNRVLYFATGNSAVSDWKH